MYTLSSDLASQVTIDKNWFSECLKNSKLVERLKKIKLVVCDIDGTVTDGTVFYNGTEEMRRYSPVNGYGVAQAKKKGIEIAFLSGNAGPSIVQRAQRLKIPLSLCELGQDGTKVEAFGRLLQKAGVSKEEAIMFGDDALDVWVKGHASLFVAPISSLFYIQAQADLVIPRAGGNHALRLLLDLILYVQKKHFMQEYLEKIF